MLTFRRVDFPLMNMKACIKMAHLFGWDLSVDF
jgi:hypothetical protein